MALLLGLLKALTSSILRLAITVGVLVALYFLLLKPAIDGGEKTVSNSLHSIEKKAGPKHLEDCIQRAGGDLDKIKRCARIF
jgi:hypothetical protein